MTGGGGFRDGVVGEASAMAGWGRRFSSVIARSASDAAISFRWERPLGLGVGGEPPRVAVVEIAAAFGLAMTGWGRRSQ